MKVLHPERVLVVKGSGAWASLLGDVLVFPDTAIALASTFREAIALLRGHFDLIFTEVKIGRERCFPFLSEVAAHPGNGPIVAISGSAPLRDVFLLPDYGVRHFIEYPVSRNKLESVLSALEVNQGSRVSPVKSGPIGRVSAMEHATLDCVLRGMTYKEIAAFRGVSTHTVKSQIRSILTKMGASNQKELMRRMLPGDARLLAG